MPRRNVSRPQLTPGQEETEGPRTPPPGRRLRLQAWLRRRALDRQLADGRVRMTDPAVALRARELCTYAERRAIAAGLATILDAADERQTCPASPLILDHVAVLSLRDEITTLIERLRSDAVCDVQGIALASLLLEEPRSPLFRASRRTLAQALAEIFGAL